jgi:hypothetical protein
MKISFVCVVWYLTMTLSVTPQFSIDDRMINECGDGGMTLGRGNISTRTKPVPVPHCPPQIPHDLIGDRTRVTVVGNQSQSFRF